MPELPEVEAYRRFFERHAAGRTIATVDCRDPLVVGTLGRRDLDRVLQGLTFRSTRRHGKYLFARAARRGDGRERWVVFHFGMTGDFASLKAAAPDPPYTRVLFRFRGGGALAYVDPRRFGRVAWIEDPDEWIAAKRLGPDPLAPGFGADGLRRILGARRGRIKALLLDQSAVAGIGNLYADEALFQSGLAPRRAAVTLRPEEWRRLGRALERVLSTAVRARLSGREFPRTWLFEHRSRDAACPRCGGRLASTVVGGRTTYYCTRHQKRSASGKRQAMNIASP